MLRKPLLKVLLIASLIFFILALLFYGKQIYRLLASPKIDWSVQNPQSILITQLVNPTDFSEKWKWDLVVTYQQDNPSFDKSINEYAVRVLTGVYNDLPVRFSHTLYKYIGPIPMVENPIPHRLELVGVELVPNSFILSGFHSQSTASFSCFAGEDKSQTMLTRCITIIDNNNIRARFDIDMYGRLTKEEISSILSDALELITN